MTMSDGPSRAANAYHSHRRRRRFGDRPRDGVLADFEVEDLEVEDFEVGGVES
jgi:hypothetical protein